jgi:hypothetical protein
MLLPRPLRSLLALAPALALCACAVTFPPPGGGPPQISVPGKSHAKPGDPPPASAPSPAAEAPRKSAEPVASSTAEAAPANAGSVAAAVPGSPPSAASATLPASSSSANSSNSSNNSNNSNSSNNPNAPAPGARPQLSAPIAAPTADPLERLLAARPPAHPALLPLAWLEGRYEAHDQGRGGVARQRIESYGPILGSVLQGSYIEVEAGEPKFYELISIEAKPDGVYLYLRHFSAGLVPWKSESQGPQTYRLVSAEAERAVFERAPTAPGQPIDPDHARLIYARRGAELSVRLENLDGSGGLQFEFLRLP